MATIKKSIELKSELKSSLRTRGIEYSDNRYTCMVNFETTATVRLWRAKTITAYKKYLEEMFDKINMALIEEATEDERVASVMEKKLSDLSTLNSYLYIFGEPLQPSVRKARAHLKSHVFIGIYDLEAARYDLRHETLSALKAYLKRGKNMYPRKDAKKYPNLCAFLQRIY